MRSNTFIVLFLVVFAAVKSQEEEENCVGDNQPCTPDTTCCSSNCFDGICSREEEPLIEDGAVQLESQHKKRAPTSRTMCTSTTITTPTTKPTPTSTTITTPTTKPTPTSTKMSTSTTITTPTTKPTPSSTTKSTLPCVLDGQSCVTNDDCCTENCVNQICMAPTTSCKIPGQICKFNSQCCSFSCTSTIERPFGKCLTCIHLTESCSSDKTCCSHYCNPSTSVCETLPAQSSEDE